MTAMKRKTILGLLSLPIFCFFLMAGFSFAQISTSLLPVCPKSDKCGFIDHSGKIVIKPTFLDAADFSEGLAAVKIKTPAGGKYGFIDASGKIVIEPQFDLVLPFSDGFAKFEDGKNCGFVDSTGKILPIRFEWAKPFSEGLALVRPLKSSQNEKSDNSKSGFINTKGELVIDYRFDDAEPFSEGLASACIDRRKCGYINRDGSWAIQPTFDHTESFSGGLAVVASVDNMVLHNFGFIDRTGKVVIPMKYTHARAFSEGLAAVSTDYQYGYINSKGEMVIPPTYYEAYDFSDGVAVVLVESSGEYFKKYAYIDRVGKRNSKKSYSYAGEFKNGFAMIEKRNFFAKLDSPLGKLMVCTRYYISKSEKSFWKETHFGCD